MRKKIALVGGGNIAQALIGNLLTNKVFSAKEIFVNDIRPERCDFLKKHFKVKSSINKSEVISPVQVVIIAVKPQQIEQTLSEIRPLLKPRQLIISVAAGITINYLQKMLRSPENRHPKIVRTMPNTPVAVGAGVIAMSFGRGLKPADRIVAKKIFSSCGKILVVKESQIDAITAISGSGPGYFLYLARCFQEIAGRLGLAEFAEELVRQTLYGTGIMAREIPESFGSLLGRVMSPGGTTEAAIKYWEKRHLVNVLKSAVLAAARRSKELSRR